MAGKQYKVLTAKGRRFTGSFNPQDLEMTLNSNAADGWQIVGTTWKSMSAEVRSPLRSLTWLDGCLHWPGVMPPGLAARCGAS